MPRIPDYNPLTTPGNNDLLIIEDVATNTTKKITRSNLFVAPPLQNSSITPLMLSQPITCLQYFTANATITQNVWVRVTATTVYHNYGMTASSGAVTVPYTGLYRLTIHNAFTGGGTGNILSGWSVNSTGDPNRGWQRVQNATSEAGVEQNITTKLTANDVVRFYAYCGLTTPSLKGGNYMTTGQDCSYYEITYIGPSS